MKVTLPHVNDEFKIPEKKIIWSLKFSHRLIIATIILIAANRVFSFFSYQVTFSINLRETDKLFIFYFFGRACAIFEAAVGLLKKMFL